MSDSASYQKRQDGNATVFETTPAPCPKYWFVLILGALMAIAAANAGLGGLLGIIMWSIPLLAVWSFFRDPRPKGTRAPATLRVSAGKLVTTSGLTFQSTDIAGIQLDNLYSEGGSGTAVNGKDLGLKRKLKVRAVSWLLRLDRANNEPSINIACGLDHATAEKLLQEISASLTKKATESLL